MSAEPRSRRHVLSALLDSPRTCGCLAAAGALHVGLCATGLGGWPCPFRQATGWPCPGCGLGHACALLFQGRWIESLRVHAYAPVMLAAIGLLAVGTILRGRARERWRNAVLRFEKWMPVVPALIVGLLIYWLARLALDGAYFRSLGV